MHTVEQEQYSKKFKLFAVNSIDSTPSFPSVYVTVMAVSLSYLIVFLLSLLAHCVAKCGILGGRRGGGGAKPLLTIVKIVIFLSMFSVVYGE